ncbi:uncharacterized protein LOC143231011 [Tachypleus tridentatus]|uniref:uncharacterized protein LOC143231011 n=1 Tax=Tachypleus tridentatus TaxID=6853 RepID=UPI003FD2E230
MAENIADLLCSGTKLNRDKGYADLMTFLEKSQNNNCSVKDIENLQNILVKLLNNDTCWEKKLGALLGVKGLLSFVTASIKRQSETSVSNGSTTTSNVIELLKSDTFFLEIFSICEKLLTHEEVRIRLTSGEVIGLLCQIHGTKVYNQCQERLLTLIKDNLEREISDVSTGVSQECKDDEKSSKKTLERQGSADAAQIFHDTAGWKCLETSMKCLQAVVDGCGTEFWPSITQELLDLLFQALKHTNRFVRETGYYVLGSLVACGSLQTGSCTEKPFTADRFGHQISKQLAAGLADNWSQVRLAASEATRKFLLSCSADGDQEVFFPELLPQMCLNRYYVAEGVRIYSQETWKIVAKNEGRELVAKYIEHMVNYYISQTQADNHAVREAACACIAELASKIKRQAVGPHVQKLLQTLVICFQDDSWPVRDAACLASGNFVLCYPEEARNVMDKLYPLFFTNLEDCISSVRQGAAGAIANVIRAYGEDSMKIVEGKIKSGLKGVANQPVESERYADVDKGPATFSVVKRLRDNDMELHTDKQMYSCGSLAPKMGRGGSGCSNHSFRKPSEPWELADGCINLVGELAQIQNLTTKVLEFLPLVAEATSHRHYTRHMCMLETLCKQLPVIARGVGKRHFKAHLEKFLDSVFYSLSCENLLISSAASDCLNQLSNYLGPSILRGRVEMYNPNYLRHLEAHIPSALH